MCVVETEEQFISRVSFSTASFVALKCEVLKLDCCFSRAILNRKQKKSSAF